jgi:hypothetical protein
MSFSPVVTTCASLFVLMSIKEIFGSLFYRQAYWFHAYSNYVMLYKICIVAYALNAAFAQTFWVDRLAFIQVLHIPTFYPNSKLTVTISAHYQAVSPEKACDRPCMEMHSFNKFAFGNVPQHQQSVRGCTYTYSILVTLYLYDGVSAIIHIHTNVRTFCPCP